MVKSISIPAEQRDFSINVRKLRASGKIPATIYAQGTENLSVQVDAKSFIKIYKNDKTAIFNLQIGNDSHKALVKKVQYDSLSDSINNIEFNRIVTDQKVKIIVPVEIVGESPAVKAGGVVWNPVTEIEVECLPQNIPSSVKVDISDLKNIEDAFRVGEIKYPDGVNPASGQESVVVKINPKTAGLAAGPEKSAGAA